MHHSVPAFDELRVSYLEGFDKKGTELSDQKAQERPLSNRHSVSAVEGGMIMMAVAVIMAPGVHAIAKGLGASLSPGQIAFFRFFFQFLLLFPLVWWVFRGRIPLPNASHAIRGFLLAAAAVLFFWALTHMPLAESSAIFFVEPLILTLMSAYFLGERIGPRRILAVIIGFAGAMIVIRPSFQEVGPVALLPLACAVCIAIYLTITRSLAAREDARVMQFWVCLFAALGMLPAMAIGSYLLVPVLEPVWPTATQWWILIALGAVATISHMLAIYGIRLTPATILAPFQYLEILSATVLGIWFFGDVPDGPTIVGILIIVGSGLYVFRKERMIQRQTEAAARIHEPP